MFTELVSEHYKDPKACIPDILKAIYNRVPEYLILEKDSSHLAILNIVDEEKYTPLLVKYKDEKLDAKDQFLAAVQYAEKDGHRGDYRSVPETYLEKAGLTVIPATVHTLYNAAFLPMRKCAKDCFKPVQFMNCYREPSRLSILNIIDEDENYNTPILVKYKSKKPDAYDRLLAAVQYAEADGYRGHYRSVPEECLGKAGLTIVPATIHTIYNMDFGATKKYEKTGFRQARCINCYNNVEGYCFHYGRRVSGKREACAHGNSESIYHLFYRDQLTATISASPKPGKRYTAQDVAELLNNEDFPKVKQIFTLFGKEIDMEQWKLLSRKYNRYKTVKIIE